MLLSPRVGIWPQEPQLLSLGHLLLQHTPWFRSAWILIRKQVFHLSSICEIHVPHTLSFLCHNWGKKPQNKKQKTIVKPQRSAQKQNSSFSSTFTFLTFFTSLFWEIFLRFFYVFSPFLFHFQSGLSLSLTIVPGCYPTGLSTFSLYKHITQKNTKESGNAIIKLSLLPRHSFLRQQPSFQHSWKEKKGN